MDENSVTQSQTNTVLPTSAVPATWPGAWGIYKYSKQAVMVNIGALVLLFLLSIAVNILSIVPVLGDIAAWVLGVVVSVAMMLVLLAGTNGGKMSVGDALSASFSMKSVRYFANAFLLLLIAVGSLLLLIVPFFFIFPRVMLAPYFVALDDKGPIEAIEASWNLTKGHLGKIYGLIGVSLLFGLLWIVLIGIYLTIMYAAAFTILFIFLKKLAPIAESTTTPEPTPTTETAQPTVQ